MTKAHVSIIASDASWIDPQAVAQLQQSAGLTGLRRIVGLPDLHAGRGIAVGAAFWSDSHIHPHLVGSDIGCGMALWQSDTPLRKFKLDKAEKRLSGLEGTWPGDYATRLAQAGLPPALTGEALGTIGGGNHFAEILAVEAVHDEAAFAAHCFDETQVYLMIHSGSRGLGHAILEAHLARQNTAALAVKTPECDAYLRQHDDAIGWAILNRQIIAERFMDKLDLTATRRLDICHNSVTAHAGGWLHRKGAAPADKGVIVIPGSRGDLTYVVEPRLEHADTALHSLAHGAGRKWGRTEARAKVSARYRVADLQRTRLGGRVICEDKDLIFEEAPQAYKDIHRVIADLVEADLISVIATLRPLITYKTRRP
jgi:release factor H-coupled RctB family protein